MREIILGLKDQLSFLPEIHFFEKIKNFSFDNFLIVGMGGSHLAGDLLKTFFPEKKIFLHENYDLPLWSQKDFKKTLILLSSYSGNTEEVLSALNKVLKLKLKSVVVSANGLLLKRAEELKLPYLKLPSGLQPRFALGYSFVAFLKVLREEKFLKKMRKLLNSFNIEKLEKEGKKLAEILKNKIPLIYASQRFLSLAYIWKIQFNETAKIPAFFNFFPELNHNEMTGFEVQDKTKFLSEKFYFIFLKAKNDDKRIKKRMDVLRAIFKTKNLPSQIIEFPLKEEILEVFSFISLAQWTAYYLSLFYGTNPFEVPMVEEFKKRLKE